MRQKPVTDRRCSFCRKYRSDSIKLIGSPNADPRAYICHECAQVAAAILEELQIPPLAQPVPPPEPPPDSPLAHPAAAQLHSCVEAGITRGASGADANELSQIRNLARFIFVNTDAQ